jgi:hypothetical protein
MSDTRHKPSHDNILTPNQTPRGILPVLVPCEKNEVHDGIANFLLVVERTETGGKSSQSGPKVRLLRNRDISDEAIRETLSLEDNELLRATLDLKKSRETGDSMLQEQANAKLMQHFGWAGVDPKVFSHPGWSNVHVPQLATAPMEEARLVLWYSGKSKLGSSPFVPAIYCPNLKSALFVRAFLSLQTCPHCGVLFLPEKENVIYCCEAHGHAHRVARSRYLKAMRVSKRGKHAKK